MNYKNSFKTDKRILNAVVKVNLDKKILDKYLIIGLLDSIYQVEKSTKVSWRFIENLDIIINIWSWCNEHYWENS